MLMLGIVVYGGVKSSLMTEESSDVFNTDENWSFKMFALVVGSEYVRLAFSGATPVLSVLLLVIKLQNFGGFE
jgi:hypothetical protein